MTDKKRDIREDEDLEMGAEQAEDVKGGVEGVSLTSSPETLAMQSKMDSLNSSLSSAEKIAPTSSTSLTSKLRSSYLGG